MKTFDLKNAAKKISDLRYNFESRERIIYGGYAVAIFLIPLFVGQFLATMIFDFDDIFEPRMVRLSLVLDMALVLVIAAFIVSNLIAKRIGDRARFFHYPSAVALLFVLLFAALAHMHFLGTLNSMQTVLVMAVNAAFFWYLQRRDTYLLFALSNLFLLIILALEYFGVLSYAPFLKIGDELAPTFLDWRMIGMNGVIYFVVNGVVFSVFFYYRASLESSHQKLLQLQAELEKHNRDLQALVEEQVCEISDSQLATITALARLVESRDENTGGHIERVQAFCRILAVRLGESGPYKDRITLEFIDHITHASPLHDIGKVAIADRYLRKSNKLTSDETDVMRKHTILGAETLEAVAASYPRNVLIHMGIAIARNHHEWWDGTGYPNGLTGKEIPLAARIMALADVYDALRSERAYKKAYTHAESRDRIARKSGTQFDPAIIDAFLEVETLFDEVFNQMPF